jgi:hypothetical protein
MNGVVKKALIEIKPQAQTVPPKQRKKTKRFLQEMTTYSINESKWKAARSWCEKNNFDFFIFTEKHLGIK